jgi:hypothetical protein
VRRCDAVTLASTYSAAHRCLKKSVVKVRRLNLCAHHRALELRRLKP